MGGQGRTWAAGEARAGPARSFVRAFKSIDVFHVPNDDEVDDEEEVGDSVVVRPVTMVEPAVAAAVAGPGPEGAAAGSWIRARSTSPHTPASARSLRSGD